MKVVWRQYLDIGEVELAYNVKDPLPGELRHRHMLIVVKREEEQGRDDGIRLDGSFDLIEERGVIRLRLSFKIRPLSKHRNCRGLSTSIHAVNLRVFDAHFCVQARHAVNQLLRVSSRRDAVVEVSRKLLVKSHFYQDLEKVLKNSLVKETNELHAAAVWMVDVTVRCKGNVRQHCEVPRTSSEDGIEEIGVHLLRRRHVLSIRSDDLHLDYVVAEESETARQLAVASSV